MAPYKANVTEEFKKRIKKSVRETMKGKTLNISFKRKAPYRWFFTERPILITFWIADEEGKRLAEIKDAEVGEGDIYTILDIDEMFDIHWST
jgi:hypothetical protein